MRNLVNNLFTPILAKKYTMAKTKLRYPFKTMKVGESFNVQKEKVQMVRNALAAFVQDSEPSWNFTIRNIDGKHSCIRLK